MAKKISTKIIIIKLCVIYHFNPDSCETSKCGPNKRCVMRNGHPKCICAPKCKKSSSQNKTANHHHLPTSSSHHHKRKRRYHQMMVHHHDQQTPDENENMSGNQSLGRSRRWTDDSGAHHHHHNDTWNSVSVVVRMIEFPKVRYAIVLNQMPHLLLLLRLVCN